jgi:hypothetical protein
MQPLVLWNGILIDGHNRYKIVQKHNLPFNTVDMEFDSRDDVIIWIISTQVSRRNLTPKQLTYFRGLHYNTEKKIQGTNNQYAEKEGESEKSQKETFHSKAARLAEHYNVSRNTIMRDSVAAEAISAIGKISPEAKRDILAGRIRISRKELRELLAGSEDELTDVAIKIENGTFETDRAAARTLAELENAEQENPVALILAGIKSLNAAISKLSDDLPSELQGITDNSDKAELKTALRSHIDMLESLYKHI